MPAAPPARPRKSRPAGPRDSLTRGRAGRRVAVMAWTTTADPDAFLDAAGAFLRAAPAANSVMLTTVEALRARGAGERGGLRAPLLAWWQPPGEAVERHGDAHAAVSAARQRDAARRRRPPWPTLLAARRARAPRRQRRARPRPSAFAAAWSARTGATRARLPAHAPAPPRRARPARPAAAGRAAVVAGPQHRDLLVAWYEAFAAEIEEPPRDLGPHGRRPPLPRRLALWIVDGEPVSLAGTTRAVAGAARVAPVYTPPEHRGRGYAAGGDRRRDAARRSTTGVEEVLLYTDLANPTSNRLYARLGYRPVEDSVSFVFDG